ncbi:MAG: hypothetical protein K6B70_05410 [Clostridia bacterium]|nr:hypothetical protein [Clostridia bacterium]
MKYDEVIRDFREMYRERVEQYAERFIQQRYIGTGEGLRESKEDTAGNRYFEIDFEEFKKWMEAEISSIDGKIGENTAKDIQDIYYTPEIISTSDTGYREQEETSKYTIPSPVHSTYRMYLETGKRQVYEGSIREAKAFACTVMNGCPIPLKDGNNTIFIGDGEVFYISPAGLIETLNKGSRAGSFVQYDTDKTNLPKGSNRVDIYRISESGMTFCEERNQSGGFKKTEKITVPLKDENGDFITDLDVFTEGVKKGYNHPWLVANLSQEDASKLASTLRGVLQRTSSSFVALETETELRKKVEELQASLDGKEAGIVELMSSYTDRSGKAEASISSLREENESLRRTQEEQSAQIQTLQQNNAQLETRAKTAEENSDSLRQRIEQLKEKVIQAVGKVPFVGKKVKSIFDEDVLALPQQTQKEDDFRARLHVTEPTDDKEIMDEMCKIERRIKEEAQPPMRKRKSHVTQLPMKRRVSEKDDDKFER